MLWVSEREFHSHESMINTYLFQFLYHLAPQDTAGQVSVNHKFLWPQVACPTFFFFIFFLQEEFDAITKAYYRGAQACVLTFSTTDRCSFEAVRDWKKKVENECGEIPTVLVQNKIDMMDHAVVSL